MTPMVYGKMFNDVVLSTGERSAQCERPEDESPVPPARGGHRGAPTRELRLARIRPTLQPCVFI